MGKINSYQDLDVWIQCRILVKEVYKLSKAFPREEQFGLTNQIRRASVSIPSNIAEGCGRNYFKDSLQFFFIARGSLYEVETQLLLSLDLGFVTEIESEQIQQQITKCKKLLNGFINYYQAKTNNHQPTTINETTEEYGNNN